ncbi:MAG TPA: RDD family protein [Nitriliruptorales bacterium]|nr:RDD family protein [Nitriliruptorales bacterium]
MSSPAGIVTPEAVLLDLDTASVGSRAIALLLDLILMAVAGVALVLAVVGMDSAAGDAGAGWVAVTLALMLLLGVQFGYPIAFETLWHGRTPGKAALGLRVVTAEGGPVGFRHAAIRAAFGIVDFYVSFGAVAVISALLSPRDQRVGDLAAGTVVLRERTGREAPQVVRFTPPAGLEGYVALLDVSTLTPRVYGAARAFLRRAPTLPAEVRAGLAGQLADELVRRVRPPAAPTEIDAETFVRCVAAAYQRRYEATTPPLAGQPRRTSADGTPAAETRDPPRPPPDRLRPPS